MGLEFFGAEGLWPLFSTFMVFVVFLFITIEQRSIEISIFLGCIMGVFVWFWVGLFALDGDSWDNLLNVDDERLMREFQNIESSNTNVTQNSVRVRRTGIVIRRVRARREPWQDVRRFSYASRAHTGRLSMKALPPVICFRGDDEADGGSSQRDCPICIEDFNNGELIQPFGVCVHKFHVSCLNSWLLRRKTTCPVCRKDLSITVA